ncbi:hypothetical protein COCCADRAFT_103086, partial [Bipolaris zeicola 26-R-13]
GLKKSVWQCSRPRRASWASSEPGSVRSKRKRRLRRPWLRSQPPPPARSNVVILQPPIDSPKPGLHPPRRSLLCPCAVCLSLSHPIPSRLLPLFPTTALPPSLCCCRSRLAFNVRAVVPSPPFAPVVTPLPALLRRCVARLPPTTHHRPLTTSTTTAATPATAMF